MNWAALAATGAVIAATWRQAIGLLKQLGGLVVVRVDIEGGVGRSATGWVFKNGRKFGLGLRTVGSNYENVPTKACSELIAYENLSSDPVLFYYNGRPAVIYRNPKTEGAVRLYYLRNYFDLDGFIRLAVEQVKTYRHDAPTGHPLNRGNFRVEYMVMPSYDNAKPGRRKQPTLGEPASEAPIGESNSSFMESIMCDYIRLITHAKGDFMKTDVGGKKPLDAFPFPASITAAVVELEMWLSREKWFKARGIPWKRGWLLYGEPGTGKSTFIRVLAMTYGIPIFVIDLNGLSNDSLRDAWANARRQSPCFVLLEDIDAIFDQREYIGSTDFGSHLTFDGLLNCMSGAQDSDGIFVVITTNNISKLDPALGIPTPGQESDTLAEGRTTRPGRVDRAIRFGSMGDLERRRVAEQIMSDWPQEIDELVAAGKQEMAAQFQDRCVRRALELFWQQQHSASVVKAE